MALEEEQVRRWLFYERLTEDDKTEFINGETFFHTPAQFQHNNAVLYLATAVRLFVETRGLGLVQAEKALVSLTRNDYEPDVAFWPAAVAAAFRPEQMQFPPPAWVAEVLSPSTEERDRGIKWHDYALHGVGEYWIVDPEKERVEIFLLPDGEKTYEGVGAFTGREILVSRSFPGIDLPAAALFHPGANREAIHRLLGGAGR